MGRHEGREIQTQDLCGSFCSWPGRVSSLSCAPVYQHDLSSQYGTPARFYVYLLGCKGALGPGDSNGSRYRAATSFLSLVSHLPFQEVTPPALALPAVSLMGGHQTLVWSIPLLLKALDLEDSE